MDSINDKIHIFLDANHIEHSCNVDLKKKTWIKTGGIASIWITPTSIDQLEVLGVFLYENNINFEIVGYTSNIFFRNDYNPNVVISTVKLKNYSIDDNKVICDCGLSISALSKSLVKIGYSGFYGLIDLPGTIAAAICNNAGCYDCSVSSHLDSVRFLTSQGEIKTLRYDDLEFSLRTTILKEKKLSGIILQVTLKVELSQNPKNEVVKAEDVHNKRVLEQEGPFLNLGSVCSRYENRRCFLDLILRGINKIFKLTSKQRKRVLLFLYGYNYLDKYISDKSINTFIWRDAKAEVLFGDYEKFRRKVHKDIEIEIEVKDGK